VKAENAYENRSPVKSRRPNKALNNSIDVQPISKNTKALSMRTLSPSVSRQTKVKEVKPILGVNLKIEVAKANPKIRAHMLETAYVMEEMLISVE